MSGLSSTMHDLARNPNEEELDDGQRRALSSQDCPTVINTC